ncbi:MAG: GAF domain-containing protein [Terriglobales bacterium]
MFGSAQPDTPIPLGKETTADGQQHPSAIPNLAPANGDRILEEHELEAALQLLVERAQYITGATGAALALTQGEEMVCRASVGSSGPSVGARLQVRSGLSGESISRKQLLRCDNAETDPRVNLETCRKLGIASIVVLPLLGRSGEVRGLFELFSDHAYAFEERDLIALERMADLTLTALDLAERRRGTIAAPAPDHGSATPAMPAEVSAASAEETQTPPASLEDAAPHPASPEPAILPAEGPLGPAQVHSALFEEPVPGAQPAAVPEAMRRVQKCASCGFPVSEGRTLCVDCENKRYHQGESTEPAPAEFVPAFLASSPPPDESWLANHVNLLAVLVLILSIVVAVVVFR